MRKNAAAKKADIQNRFITFAGMNMKYRRPLILFVTSFILVFGGMAFKVMHWPAAGIVFGAGMMVQLFAIIWLIFVILKPGKKD